MSEAQRKDQPTLTISVTDSGAWTVSAHFEDVSDERSGDGDDEISDAVATLYESFDTEPVVTFNGQQQWVRMERDELTGVMVGEWAKARREGMT